MTPKQLARIQTHLANEAAGPPPPGAMDAVVWGLIEDAQSPSDVMDVAGPARRVLGVPTVRLTVTRHHASGGDVSPVKPPLDTSGPFCFHDRGADRISHVSPGASGTEARAPGGGGPPLCLFGPGGNYRYPWP